MYGTVLSQLITLFCFFNVRYRTQVTGTYRTYFPIVACWMLTKKNYHRSTALVKYF
jgi:hypothetical protein